MSLDIEVFLDRRLGLHQGLSYSRLTLAAGFNMATRQMRIDLSTHCHALTYLNSASHAKVFQSTFCTLLSLCWRLMTSFELQSGISGRSTRLESSLCSSKSGIGVTLQIY